MKWDMEILPPASHIPDLSKWTAAENKAFENALAMFDENTPDRWHKVAAMVPGKTVGDVIKQYEFLEIDVNKIEAGLVAIPGYGTSPFTLEWGSGHDFDGLKQSFAAKAKRSSANKPSEQERKKGVPWTEQEHRLFLMGLKKYGKGDWRNISRNFVTTRSPTQVASHAQKYFIRQLSGGKDKRRASIHDITTVSLNDNQFPSPDSKKTLSPDDSNTISQPQPPQPNSNAIDKMPFQWNQGNNGAVMNFNMGHGNLFMSPNGANSYDIKMQGQDLQRGGAIHDYYIGCQNLVFQHPHA